MAFNNVKINNVALPTPTTLQYDWEDVSSSDAGRVESGKMQKNMLGHTRAISLTWKNINTPTMQAIMQMIRPEYFRVTYDDPYLNERKTIECYAGNRSATLYNGALDIWSSVSVKLIERSVSTD